MDEPFVVAFVAGVTPGKWARVWAERMPQHPLSLTASDPDAALSAIADGSAHVALVRLPVEDDRFSVIPLYTELPVVVLPKDHELAEPDSLTLADLEGAVVLDGQGADTVELVAANVGVAIMPQSVARTHSRRDVVARMLTDGPETRIALVWLAGDESAEVEEFIGIVRGRTANSSRGSDKPEPEAPPKPPEPPRRAKKPVRPKGPTPRKKGPKKR